MNKKIILVAMMSAFICILSPFSLPIPFSPTPISLGTLGVYLAGGILGMKKGTTSVFLYLILGIIGLPVFAGFMGGIGRIFAPSGGYLLSYIFIAFTTGYFSDKYYGKNNLCIIVGMVLGTIICYLIGSFYMAFNMGFSVKIAFLKGVAPYIIGDILKMVGAYFIILQIKSRVMFEK